MQNRNKIDAEMKAKILQQYNQGVSAVKLAETYKCGVSTVYAWAKESRNKQERVEIPEELVNENKHLKQLLLIFLKHTLNSP
jgi:Transposase.